MSKFITVITLLFVFSVSSVFAQKCELTEEEYQNKPYKIREVKISSPLGGMLGSVDGEIKKLIGSKDMPVKKGDDFNIFDLEKAKGFLVKNYPTLSADGQKFAIRFSAVELANCKDDQLDIVFLVVGFRPSYYLSRTFELGKKDELKRSAVGTETTDFLQKVTVQPFLAYDRTRNFYAGTKVKVELPENQLFEKAEIDVAGSNTTQEIKAELNGGRDYWKGFIRHHEWRINYLFSNLPANDAKIQENLGTAQYYASTKTLTKGEAILRFGGSFEVGNEIADVQASDLASDTIPNSRVVSGKMFVGTSFKIKNQNFKASYGVELGAARGGKALDFVKHIFDFGAKFEVSPVTAEVNLSSGYLNILGRAPIGKRFFGGNVEKGFIEGSAWQINVNPIIRSFPANDFASAENTNSRGGDSFTAFNLTLSVPVWRKPLIPKSAWEDPNQPGQLTENIKEGIDLPFKVGEQELMFNYLKDSDELLSFSSDVNRVDKILTGTLKPLLEDVSQTNSGERVKVILGLLFAPAGENSEKDGRFDLVESIIKEVRVGLEGSEPEKTRELPIEDLVNALTTDELKEDNSDFEPCGVKSSGLLSYITNLNLCLEELAKQVDAGKASTINQSIKDLEGLRASLAAKFQQLAESPRRREAEKRAQEELVYPRTVLDYLIRKADLLSVNPVFVFDAIRLKQNDLFNNPWRYGAGGGVKFRFIFLDLTAGYVWNLNRRPGEQSGAFLFNVNVIDLLR